MFLQGVYADQTWQLARYHRVYLVETNLTIYTVTSKGQLHFFTSGQGQNVT